MMATSLLVWAARDVAVRAPVVFWSAITRLLAIISVLYAVPNGLADSSQYAFVVFDGSVAIVCIFGTLCLTGRSCMHFLLWRVGLGPEGFKCLPRGFDLGRNPASSTTLTQSERPFSPIWRRKLRMLRIPAIRPAMFRS